MKAEPSPEGTPQRKRFDEEFRRSVVDHWRSSGKRLEQVAREFGVSSWTLRHWRRRYQLEAKPVDAPLPATPEAMAQEIQQLRKELARVILQRDILKKTMGILSEGPGSAMP